MRRPTFARALAAAPIALLLLGSPGPLAAADPISHWAFDETSGTDATDDAGDHDGSLLNGAVFAPGAGISGGAVRLDGIDDHVSMGDVLGPDEYLSGTFSISVWFRSALPAPTEQWIVSKHQPGNLNGYALAIGSNGGTGGTANHAWLYVSSLPGALPISTTVVDDGYWHHLVGVYDPVAHTVKIYVDGVLEDSNAESAHIDNAAALSVGGSGLVDEVSFFGDPLTDEEVEALYLEHWLFHDSFEVGGVCDWTAVEPPCL